MMKCVAIRLNNHLKNDTSYNLLQAEVLHHTYNANLEGFMEARNTYLGLEYNDAYPVSVLFSLYSLILAGYL